MLHGKVQMRLMLVLLLALSAGGCATWPDKAFARHPILGEWEYEYNDQHLIRVFTSDGECRLIEGGTIHWKLEYAIVDQHRVVVLVHGKALMHTILPNGSLDIEGVFIAKKVRD